MPTAAGVEPVPLDGRHRPRGTPARILFRAGVRSAGRGRQRPRREAETGRALVGVAGRGGAEVVAISVTAIGREDATQHRETTTSSTTTGRQTLPQLVVTHGTDSTMVPQHGLQQGLQHAARRCRWQQAASASTADSVVAAHPMNTIRKPIFFTYIFHSPLVTSC